MSATVQSIMITLIFLFCLSLLLFAIYTLSKRRYNYWAKKNVPHLKPTPFLGNYGDYILMKKNIGVVAQGICEKFLKEPYVGAYFGPEPALILQDPELIKLITAKDFPYFNGREITRYTHKETLTQNLFFTYGDRWKVIRQNMSPLFTSSKIKTMFPLVQKCAHVLEEFLDRETSVSDVVKIQPLMARYTMDCICSCGFGVDTNTMAKDSDNNPFAKMGQLIFDNSYVRGFSLAARAVWPAIFYGIGLRVFPKSIDNFFMKLLTGVFESRQYKPSTRNDFVDMVLSLPKTEDLTCEKFFTSEKRGSDVVRIKVDNDFMIAQCVVFFAAGFETSATTLHFTLFELAKNQEAQRRAIEEVDDYLIRHKGKIEYDCVNELTYLQACIDEALRLYPVLSVLAREVMQDYTLPTGLHLEKGMRIHLPVYHLHRHPDYFPNPNQFQPERFLPDAKHQIPPYIYIPFGEGPRLCIGMRIAKMQMLPGIVTVLKKYRVSLADGMPRTLDFDPRAFVLQPTTPIKLRLTKRDQ